MIALLAASLLSGSAAYFNGSSSGRISGAAGIIHLDANFTVEAWVKLDSAGVGRTFQPIFYQHEDNRGFELTVVDRPNHRLMTPDLAQISHAEKPVIPVDRWVHVAYSRSLERACLYLDGKLAIERDVHAPLPLAPSDLFIGSSQYLDQEGKPVSLIGAIDEVQIWSVARSGGNIRRTRFRHPNRRNSLLAAYFPMDERYGSKQPNAKDKKMVLTLTNISWVKGPTASSPAQLMRG